MLDYKRISRGFWNYALYPADINIDELIHKHGPRKDYYQSIYNYKEEHYSKFIDTLKKGCIKLNLKYDDKNILDLTAKVLPSLKRLAEVNKDKEALALYKDLSVSGTSNVTTNRIVFDFDSKDPEEARIDTMTVIDRLLKFGFEESSLQISFSGNKGFSVEIETTNEFSRKQFEDIINHFAGDLETFDKKIKDEQRLFRIPLTIHNSSGLYKIPITLKQLNELTVHDIRILADPKNVEKDLESYYDTMNGWIVTEKDTSVFFHKPKESDPDLSFLDNDNIESSLPRSIEDAGGTGNSIFKGLDLSRKPSWLSATKYALQEGYFIEGERNTAFMVLASTYKANGFPKEVAFGMLKGVAELQSKRTGMELYPEHELEKNVLNFVYSDLWKGGTYSEKETDLLKKTVERFGIADTKEERGERKLYSIGESLDRFKDYAKNFSKNRVKIGLESLDNDLVITTGMAIGILGAPSSGKTTFSNRFMRYTSMNNERVLFESLDMSENFIIARFVQNYIDIDFETLMKMLETDNISPELAQAMDKVCEDYKNVSINYKTGTNVEDIETDIKKHQELHGSSPRLVVVDYLEKIRGPYTDSNANTGYIISRLSDMAKEYNTCILILLQPQKNAGDPRYPLLSMRKVKGSSVIEQDCRVILTIWRPGFNTKSMEDDKYVSIAVVKNNMGKLGQYDFAWDGLNGSLREMTDDEAFNLQQLNERLEEEREASEESFSGY